MMRSNNPNLNLAGKAIRRVGRMLLRDFSEVRQLQNSVKGTVGFSDRAWRRAEDSLVEELQTARPAYSYECTNSDSLEGNDTTRVWKLNVSEGRENFVRGLPRWGISIALLHKGKPELSLIMDPLENELFLAEKGTGSWLNHSRIRVSNRTRPAEFLVGTDWKSAPGVINPVRVKVMQTLRAVRISGSPVLDLAYLSCARIDGFWSEELCPSEVPAADLLVSEAGGFLSPLTESANTPKGLVAAGTLGFKAFEMFVKDNAVTPPPQKIDATPPE